MSPGPRLIPIEVLAGITKGVNQVAEKKISPTRRGKAASSTKSAATRVTKRATRRKSRRKR